MRSDRLASEPGFAFDVWSIWRDALKDAPDFAASESPFYIGRAVVTLATDPNIMQRTGNALSTGYLAREYGFTDIDGAQPSGYCPEGTFNGGEFVFMGLKQPIPH